MRKIEFIEEKEKIMIYVDNVPLTIGWTIEAQQAARELPGLNVSLIQALREELRETDLNQEEINEILLLADKNFT